MMKYLQQKYALSEQGAKDLFKGILYSVLAYISLMLPVTLLACVLNALLAPLLGDGEQGVNAFLYTVLGIVILAVIFLIYYKQYTITYMGTYEESERRRITLAEKLRTMPLHFFQEHDLSDLTNTIMGDCSGFEHAFSHTVPQFWGSIISTAIVCIALLVYDWRMGLALLWVAPAAFAIVLLSRKLQGKIGQKHIDAKLALADGIQECLETVQDIKACNLEEGYLKKLDEKMDSAEKAQISSEMVSASLITTGQMFLRLGLATVIVVGNQLMLNGQTTLFSYILFLIAASRLYDPLSGAMANMAELFAVDQQVNRLKTIQNYKEEEKQKEYQTKGHDITFEHVRFAYEPGKPILRDVSFTAKQGQVTALVGPSGGGKTTLARLIARFADATEGKIKIGGVDVKSIDSKELMDTISFVFQDSHLLKMSIFDNVRMGKKDATREEVMEALKNAQCEDIIDKLSDGIDTVIGSKGTYLSGGEAQRISIARAMLKNAPILILDEATAFADPDNEAKVQAAFTKLSQGKTVIMIAHRLSSVVGVDRICVLKEGEICQSGKHEELEKTDGLYAHMWGEYNKSVCWKVGV